MRTFDAALIRGATPAGAQRRVRALMARGWPLGEIAGQAGVEAARRANVARVALRVGVSGGRLGKASWRARTGTMARSEESGAGWGGRAVPGGGSAA